MKANASKCPRIRIRESYSRIRIRITTTTTTIKPNIIFSFLSAHARNEIVETVETVENLLARSGEKGRLLATSPKTSG